MTSNEDINFWNKIVNVKISDDGANLLIYRTNITTPLSFKIQKGNSSTNGLRFITATLGKRINQMHLLFEDNEESNAYFKSRISQPGNHFSANFSGLIFLFSPNFEEVNNRNESTFDKSISFSQCIINTKFTFTNFSFLNSVKIEKSIFLSNVNFNNCTFEKNVIFSNCYFNEEIDFAKSTFKECTKFETCIFKEFATFKESRFFEFVSFDFSIFDKDVYFKQITCEKDATFESTKFYADVDFEYSSFKGYTSFMKTCFLSRDTKQGTRNEVIFRKSIFSKNISFNLMHIGFPIQIIFEEATIKGPLLLTSSDTNKNGNLLIEFKNLYLDEANVHINSTLIDLLKKAPTQKRSTYTFLKSSTLRQRDNILALELHRLEFNTYYKELSKKNNKRTTCLPAKDFLIICFEKYASDFGTNAGKAMLWWIGVLVFFGVLMLSLGIKGQAPKARPNMADAEWIRLTTLDDGVADVFTVTNVPKQEGEKVGEKSYHIENQELLAYSFNPISIITDKSILKGNTYWWLIEVLNFIKTIILTILAYEITKSLRRFSRKF